MMRRLTLVGLTLALGLGTASARFTTTPAAPQPTVRVTDQEFWRLIADMSEPNGFFDSDNLISNEDRYQTVIPELERTVPPGRAYIGVGPDQNFAYILAIAPRISFITDVRRGNLHVHLMYKALVEISADRAEFLSRLFSRRRPAGLGAASTASELFQAYESVAPDRALYDENLRAIIARLRTARGLALPEGDEAGIDYVYSSFFKAGPALTFVSSRPGNRYPTYREMQTADDGRGVNRGYLGSEALFRRLKMEEESNAIVPLVGNFAGPRAIRAVGAYLASHGLTVGAFYTSNVEQYLFQDGLWDAFADNVRALPVDGTSTFIRSCFNSCSSPSGSRAVNLLDSMAVLLRDAASGRIGNYRDVLAHSH